MNSANAFIYEVQCILSGLMRVNGAVPYAGTKTLYLYIIIKDGAFNHHVGSVLQ